AVLALIPPAWLLDASRGVAPDLVSEDLRAHYRAYLLRRLAPPRPFAQEALRAR
ncbi:MAG: aminotransferase class I and II, partial [Chloroflexi bacterium]|nr:aminotransferase class I and II [Chloroflexota bacterium]